MNEDTRQIDDIFAAAIDIASREERNRFVESACGENHEMKLRVQRLLASHDRAEGFLESAAPGLAGLSQQMAVQRSFDVSPGSTIGAYRIVKQIGEGGIGTVFLAEQSEPVRRSVALKVIKLGMDTQQVIQRFEAERQALALMNHPNIARVFDAGTTAIGRPYFVMELVEGVPISDYCDSNQLDIKARLALFVQVCQAVHHAHQKGLIHRDIKPGNVLVSTVDDQPVAKVIDFGIAKATGAQARDKTLFTQDKQLIGTIEYMSPEQAEGSLDIDIRTDVYSLGVVLYELLTGRTPFEGSDLRSKAYGEMQRIIRETEPQKPSTRLSKLDTLAELARQRGINPRELNSAIKGELDWIVMKCIEKDRGRRYESAAALAADVHHYLSNEPVSAAAPSRMYRARKFVRRHRGPVIASVAVLLALIGGIIGTTVGLIGQARQRAIAERERSESQRQEKLAKEQTAVAEAVQKFQSDMLASADPGKLLGDKVTVLQAISAAVKELDDGKLKDRPLVEAAVRDTIGNTLRDLGRHELAEPNLRKAVELRQANLPSGTRAIAQSMENLAILLDRLQKYDEGERMHREAIRIFSALDPPDEQNIATALNNLAGVARSQNKLPEAEKYTREALSVYRRILPADHSFIAISLSNVAQLLLLQGKFAEAEPIAREALAALRKNLPAGHPNIGAALSTMYGLLERQGKIAEAEPFAREANEIFSAALPADHPNRAMTSKSLGGILYQLRREPEAEPFLREAIRIFSLTLPAEDLRLIDSKRLLAAVLSNQGKYAEADTLFREAFQSSAADPNKTGQTARIHLGHGTNLMRLERFAESESELLAAVASLVRDPPDAIGVKVIETLVELYEAWDKSEPGKSAKASEWRKKLASPTSTSAPATPR